MYTLVIIGEVYDMRTITDDRMIIARCRFVEDPHHRQSVSAWSAQAPISQEKRYWAAGACLRFSPNLKNLSAPSPASSYSKYPRGERHGQQRLHHRQHIERSSNYSVNSVAGRTAPDPPCGWLTNFGLGAPNSATLFPLFRRRS